MLEQGFTDLFDYLSKQVHANAEIKGFWQNDDADYLDSLAPDAAVNQMDLDTSIRTGAIHKIAAKLRARNDGEMICLMHAELSEALEALRHGNGPSDHIPEFSGVEEEMADCIIRIMDYSAARKLRLGPAIIAKMKFNATRPQKHGKKF